MIDQILHTGLTRQEVATLRDKHGFNEVREKNEHAIVRLAKKFIGPIPLMIEVALVLSAIIQDWEDFFIIALLLIVNIAVDFFQEQKAHAALRALKQTLAPTAVVLRDETLKEIPARELVPGDVVKVNIGDVIPADLTIIDKGTLLIDQSVVTGESLPVERHKDDSLLSGSIVQKGSAFARVHMTGTHTLLGKNIELVNKAEMQENSHFQKAIIHIGKLLILLSSAIVLLIFMILIARGESLLEMARFALVLAIASIPVALPAVLSVTMAIGANLLARKNTIVSNFRAIEELAGISRLCVDKTGTLTKNEIAVSTPKVYSGYTEEELFVYAVLALEDGQHSPIERAVHAHVSEHGHVERAEQYTVTKFVPFDPEVKVTRATFTKGGKEQEVVMGAPQVIRELVGDAKDAKKLAADVETLADEGFRSLGVALVSKKQCVPVGVIPLMDPPRDDSKKMLSEIKKRGIVVKMLTGDNHAIARYIAHVLKIGTNIIDRSVLSRVTATKESADDRKVIDETDVFSEVIPEDKFHIVRTLQEEGHIVAMTGDGVNDAPALKKADIGIAVSGATPAARAASDIILLNSGLSIIKDAVDQARQTFARMEAYATFRISETIRIIFFIALAVLVFNFTPLTAVMIIMLALLNDIPVLAIAYDNVPTSETPVRWQLRETFVIALALGIVGVISSFGLLYYLSATGVSVAVIQAIFFVKLDVAGHSTLYLTRTGRKHFWQKPYPSLKFFIPAFSSRLIGSLIAFFGILMPALSLSTIVAVWLYATVWLFINDKIKVWIYRRFDAQSHHSKSKKITHQS